MRISKGFNVLEICNESARYMANSFLLPLQFVLITSEDDKDFTLGASCWQYDIIYIHCFIFISFYFVMCLSESMQFLDLLSVNLHMHGKMSQLGQKRY